MNVCVCVCSMNLKSRSESWRGSPLAQPSDWMPSLAGKSFGAKKPKAKKKKKKKKIGVEKELIKLTFCFSFAFCFLLFAFHPCGGGGGDWCWCALRFGNRMSKLIPINYLWEYEFANHHHCHYHHHHHRAEPCSAQLPFLFIFLLPSIPSILSCFIYSNDHRLPNSISLHLLSSFGPNKNQYTERKLKTKSGEKMQMEGLTDWLLVK